jgi:ribonuclease HI
MGNPKKYYAVVRGVRPGIYPAWYGPEGAEAQVRGFAGALYRGFSSLPEAQQWLNNPEGMSKTIPVRALSVEDPDYPGVSSGQIAVYTDGGCLGNPGPGGYGAVILSGGKRKELAQGYRLTTNNRMELTACIAALATLKTASDVVLHSDSQYVVNGISKGWARRWRANGWMRTKEAAAENADLWDILLDLCDIHKVRFVWVRGHRGNRENERCDRLAVEAAQGKNLKEDVAYVRGRTTLAAGT